MDLRDKEFEEFLRQFQPRRPAALPHQLLRPVSWARRFALAAVFVLVCGGALFLWRFQNRPTRVAVIPEATTTPPSDIAERMTLGRLTQLAIVNPDMLDTTLRDISRTMLPHVERLDSTLHVLAKD